LNKNIVRIATNDDKDAWNQFVEKSEHSSVFHLWEWGELISEVYGHRRYYLLVEQNGEIVAVFPLIHIKSGLFGDKLISLPFCEHGGAVAERYDEAEKNSSESLYAYVRSLAASLDVDYVEVRAPALIGNSTERLFRSHGYQKIEHYVTFRLGLDRSCEEIWKSVEGIKRKAVRKALKNNVRVRIAKDEGEVAAFYKLYLETQKRLGSPPHSHEFFKAMWNKLYPIGCLQISLAEYDNEVIGGNIVLPFRKEIYWWINATKAKYRSLNATNLLLWNTIEFGVNNGFRVFDMGRTRRDSDVYEFKQPWHGLETSLSDFVYSTKEISLPDPSQRRYVIMSKIWRRLPDAIAEKLGPSIVSRIGL